MNRPSKRMEWQSPFQPNLAGFPPIWVTAESLERMNEITGKPHKVLARTMDDGTVMRCVHEPTSQTQEMGKADSEEAPA